MDEEIELIKRDISKLFDIVKNHKEYIEHLREKIRLLGK